MNPLQTAVPSTATPAGSLPLLLDVLTALRTRVERDPDEVVYTFFPTGDPDGPRVTPTAAEWMDALRTQTLTAPE